VRVDTVDVSRIVRHFFFSRRKVGVGTVRFAAHPAAPPAKELLLIGGRFNSSFPDCPLEPGSQKRNSSTMRAKHLLVVDDDPAEVAEWLPAFAQELGAKKPVRVPRFFGRLLAGEAGVVMMTDVRGASNAKAKRELGWRPAHPSWRQGFTAT
jgi:hypothetical protein